MAPKEAQALGWCPGRAPGHTATGARGAAPQTGRAVPSSPGRRKPDHELLPKRPHAAPCLGLTGPGHLREGWSKARTDPSSSLHWAQVLLSSTQVPRVDGVGRRVTLQLGAPSFREEKPSNKIRIKCFSSSFPGNGTDMSVTFSTDLEKTPLRTSWLC